ncbi:hypothetical protein L596_019649 [Steinernema carpocapsae]|uniref:Uncharacterized protein n=1 Tax=Steinernema carpocapsae TaxID=34508 RepID=A0A4U5MR60_STECR|nr:hypothetical protein L596_019649 [Steinernema carpocapsae]
MSSQRHYNVNNSLQVRCGTAACFLFADLLSDRKELMEFSVSYYRRTPFEELPPHIVRVFVGIARQMEAQHPAVTLECSTWLGKPSFAVITPRAVPRNTVIESRFWTTP